MKLNLTKIGRIVLATNLIGLGVALILKANIGSDSITVFQDGIHVFLTITYGSASRLYNLILISIALMFGRKYIGIGTVISAFLVGFLIDFYLGVISMFFIQTSLSLSLILFIVGQTVYSIGLAVLIYFEVGMSCLDCVLYGVYKKIRISYRDLRIAVDLTLTLMGIVLGGKWGIGTVYSVLFTGTIINLSIRYLSIQKKKAMQKIVEKIIIQRF